METLVKKVHWQNEEAMQKPGGNGWRERRRKKNVLHPFGYILLTAFLHLYIYIYVHHGHLENLVYYYYHISALLVRYMTEVSLLMGKDENAKSFLWSLFHVSRAAKERAAEQEWETELYQGQGMGREDQKGICRARATEGLNREREMSVFFKLCNGGKTGWEDEGAARWCIPCDGGYSFSRKWSKRFSRRQLRHCSGPN